MSCAKAQGFLAHIRVPVKEVVSASAKLGRTDALKLARASSRVVAAKGRNLVAFDMKKAPPDDETLLAAMLGPTGNLRAPTLRVGRTLLVGFNEEMYRDALG